MNIRPSIPLLSTDRRSRSPTLRVLAVSENAAALSEALESVQEEGGSLEVVSEPGDALRLLASEDRITLLLVHLGAEDAEDRLAWWAETLEKMSRRPRLAAIVPSPSIGFSLRATQLGVLEVLDHPIDRRRLLDLLLRVGASEDETILPLPDAEPQPLGGGRLVAESPAMLPVFRVISQVAKSPASVLILGESGTGKELVARAIHEQGARRREAFVAVNCAAIPENLLESELFGHEKGAFTGAVAQKIGRIERAHGGTLFLDEIGDMSLTLQGKILRAIQEREIERVGATHSIPVDVRIISATHRDLGRLIAEERFREDLYYRLAVMTIHVPRLAERGDDLLLLTSYYLREFGRQYEKRIEGISDRALDLLRRHEWLGNVRELRNVIERAVLITDGSVLRAEHLPEEWRTVSTGPVDETPKPLASLKEVEARHIARVLDHTQGQIGEAAQVLGIHRNTLSRKIREYGL